MTDDGEEKGSARRQQRGRRAGRPSVMADGSYLSGEGGPAHPPHHVRLAGSPAKMITRANMTISGHRAKEMTAWATGPERLIWPG